MNKDKKSSAPDTVVCSNCLKPEGSENVRKLSACSRCGLVLYCGRKCQSAHWKENHKQRCIAKADRAPKPEKSLGSRSGDTSTMVATGEECSICMDSLIGAPTTALQCTHVFHVTCVAEIRQLGVKQACPLCRTPLPPGSEELADEAARRFMMVSRLVSRGEASWSALPTAAQRDVDAAFAAWQAAAEKGDDLSQFNLGVMLRYGQGVVRNDVEAARWWRKAAEQGNADAQCSLGVMYQNGLGVKQSDKEAARWFKKAAGQGDADAQYNLGCLFEEGRGVAQSDIEAAHWFKESALKGEAKAQYNYGFCLKDGCGVAQNVEEGARWMRKAAEQGLAEAQFIMGYLSKDGRGVPQSDFEAARWYKMAADQGHEKAQMILAYLSMGGRGGLRTGMRPGH